MRTEDASSADFFRDVGKEFYNTGGRKEFDNHGKEVCLVTERNEPLCVGLLLANQDTELTQNHSGRKAASRNSRGRCGKEGIDKSTWLQMRRVLSKEYSLSVGKP